MSHLVVCPSSRHLALRLMLSKRSSGILLHPTSLPSRGGIGDLGPAAYEFIDWLAAAKQTLWQILPLGPVGYGNSPYSCTSAFAGNVLMISLERLAERGLLERSQVEALPDGDSAGGFRQRARRISSPFCGRRQKPFCGRHPALRASVTTDFVATITGGSKTTLCSASCGNSLATSLGTTGRRRSSAVILRRCPSCKRTCTGSSRKNASCNSRSSSSGSACVPTASTAGIRIIGDVAIFVSYDSADVWTHPDIFRLKEDLSPQVVAGVPPDAFSTTGQRWGNPLYDWDALKSARLQLVDQAYALGD